MTVSRPAAPAQPGRLFLHRPSDRILIITAPDQRAAWLRRRPGGPRVGWHVNPWWPAHTQRVPVRFGETGRLNSRIDIREPGPGLDAYSPLEVTQELVHSRFTTQKELARRDRRLEASSNYK